MSAQKHRGKASFYSKKATGARSSSGERIHHDSLTCAHRTLPFGTLLKVTNLSNGKSCVVRVNDRGPHSKGRIIDLSYGAARELGMLSQGIAMVEVEKVDNLKIPYREEPVETGFPDFEFDMSEILENMKVSPSLPRGNVGYIKSHSKESTVHSKESTVHSKDTKDNAKDVKVKSK